ncbi:MAG: DUF1259 domain-containing protein [Gemmatirosa sp.]|nr:DUF1259 domain-containing protein [Gemmatirosa sp.]
MGLAPHVARRLSHAGIILVFAAIAVVQGGPRATREARAVEPDVTGSDAVDARWAPVERVLGRRGIADGDALRIELPRSDVAVRVGTDTLSPRLALTTSLTFTGPHAGEVLATGEIVLRGDEADAVLAEARRQRVTVLAADDALAGETPHMLHVVVSARGDAETVATRLRAVLTATATPLAPDDAPSPSSTVDWTALDAILGAHDDAMGTTADYSFRARPNADASRAVVQQLGGARVAAAGVVHVTAGEREAVVRALAAHGLHVTTLHAHLPGDASGRVWVHWLAVGDGATIARGIAAALAGNAPRARVPNGEGR